MHLNAFPYLNLESINEKCVKAKFMYTQLYENCFIYNEKKNYCLFVYKQFSLPSVFWIQKMFITFYLI